MVPMKIDEEIDDSDDFVRSVLEGLKAAREGRLVEHEEVRKRMAQIGKQTKQDGPTSTS